PAGEGVVSLMTMVWYVARAYGLTKIHYASVHDRAANLQHPVDIVASRWQVVPRGGSAHAPAPAFPISSAVDIRDISQ
ncbi:hypothetical protein, partial [Burkholderia cenocepacia]|uniref:hypothetical protein n=1 Tax=Burkholderia cenocepacia TaxID=95486 RepID=UPI001C4E228B